MIDILLLPFMCLSLAQEGAKAEGKPYSVNEITSCVDFNTKSSQTRRKVSSSRTIIEEVSFEHASYGRAQSIGTFGIQDEDIEVRGNESQFNKTDDKGNIIFNILGKITFTIFGYSSLNSSSFPFIL